MSRSEQSCIRARRGGAAIGVTLAAGLLGVAPVGESAAEVAEGCTVDERLVNSCRPWFGTTANRYPEVTNYYNKLQQMLYAETRMGRQMEVAHTYRVSGQNSLREEDVHFATRDDTILLVNYEVTKDWSTADGSDPAVNAQIDEMAASVNALGDHRIMMAVSHEPENDVTTTAGCTGLTHRGTRGTPDQYKAMWRNVHARFDAAGVDNVVWVMNYMNYEPFNCMIEELWPGDDLVDWIVWNAYQHGNANVSFEHEARNLYDFFTARSTPEHDYLSKAWGLTEWGINLSTQENAYLFYAQAKQAVEENTFPKFKLYANFDNGDPNTGDGSYRVAYGTGDLYDPAEQAAFNAFAHSWRFTGDGTPPVVEPEDQPPGAPSDLVATTASTGRSVQLTWTAAVDDVGVASYEVLRDGVVVGVPTTTSFTDSGVLPGRGYTYTVRAVDTAGSVGEATSGVTVTTPVPDTTAPTRPSGLASSLVSNQPRLTWRASTDNVGVTGYDVLRGGVVVGTTTTTSYVDATAPQGRTSTYTVRARDAAGNVSTASSSVSRSVPDTTAPTAPGSLTATRPTRTSVRLTWTAATDNVAVTGYLVYRGTTVVARPGSTARSHTISSLPTTTQTFRVAARDARGNIGPSRSVTR